MPLEPGSLLAGKYRIEGEIGKGAYGRVYRARDTRLNRWVAIKELHKGGELGSTDYLDYVRRFEREAQVQARFNHDNIVHVYELLEPEADAYYLVMEYVDGQSLKDELRRRGKLPLDEALRIFHGVLNGLEAVHADPRDIVHRDIKPSNILITSSGQAKLADFGLAQVGDESMRSGAGQPHPGTPQYMSPEQASTTDYLHPASDLFSVGCVLFEMLTGQGYKFACSRGQSLADLRPDLPAWVSGALEQALRRDPQKRPANATALRVILEQGLRHDADVQREAENAAREQPGTEIRRQAGAEVSSQASTRREVEDKQSLEIPQPAPLQWQSSQIPDRPKALPTWVWVAGGIVVLLVFVFMLSELDGGSRQTVTPSQTVLIFSATPTAPVAVNTNASLPILAPTLANTPTPRPTSTLAAPAGMVLIPAGSFQMGSAKGDSDEEPVHTVNLTGDFYMDMYEVTNAQFAECVESRICAPPEDNSSRTRENYYGNPEYDDYPAVHVSWEAANAFCYWRGGKWLGGRLPTEAEWEYAARGGLEGMNYPWGDTLDASRANFCDVNCLVEFPGGMRNPYDDGHADTAPVGSFAPNGYGLYDMAGNVWEWVSDWYGGYPSGVVTDPVGPASGEYHIPRGGSWGSLFDGSRVSNRGVNDLIGGSDEYGFRCVIPAENWLP